MVTSLGYEAASTELVRSQVQGGALTTLLRDAGGSLAGLDIAGTRLRTASTGHHDLGLLVSDTTGHVDTFTSYDPFGQPASTGPGPGGSGARTVPVGFQGDPVDALTGLVDMTARAYAPGLGRFTSLDTVVGSVSSGPASFNRFGYGNANPVGYWDPTGRDGWWSDAWDTVSNWVGTGWDWTVNAVSAGAGWVADSVGSTVGSIVARVSTAVDWARSVYSAASIAVRTAAWKAAGFASTTMHAVVGHARAVSGQLGAMANQLVHNPAAGINMVASVAAGVIAFGACEAATGGLGSAGCVTVGFTAGSTVSAVLECPPGQSVLRCAATGAASGVASGMAFTATAGFGSITAGVLSSAAGDATTQWLTTGGVDADRLLATATLGGVFSGRTPKVNEFGIPTPHPDGLQRLRNLGVAGADAAASAGRATAKGVRSAAGLAANRATYAYYRSAAEMLDVSTMSGGAVFWSDAAAGSRAIAEAYAVRTGRQTLEMTPGGGWLNKKALFGPNSRLSADQAGRIWEVMAKRYAMQASGDVIAFTYGVQPSKQFWRIELPELQSEDSLVTNITIFIRGPK